jgi:hypothetical protein
MVMSAAAVAPFAQSRPNPDHTSSILVAVADGSGRPVFSLQATDFVIDRGAESGPALSAVPSHDPPSVMLLIDGFAGSQVPTVQRALDNTIQLWRAQTIGRVGGVADNVEATRARLGDMSAAKANVDDFRPRLPMPQSLEVGAKALAQEVTRRRAIIAVNLGTPNITSTIEHLRSVMRDANTQLWSLSVQPQGQVGARQNAGESERLLAELAEESGGIRDTIFSVSGLSDSFGRMISLILSEYEVSFDNAGRPVNSIRVRVRRSDLRAVAAWWPLH